MLENIEWTQAAGFYAHQGQPSQLGFVKCSNAFTVTNNKGHLKTGLYSLKGVVITLTFTSDEHGKQQITGRLFGALESFEGGAFCWCCKS